VASGTAAGPVAETGGGAYTTTDRHGGQTNGVSTVHIYEDPPNVGTHPGGSHASTSGTSTQAGSTTLRHSSGPSFNKTLTSNKLVAVPTLTLPAQRSALSDISNQRPHGTAVQQHPHQPMGLAPLHPSQQQYQYQQYRTAASVAPQSQIPSQQLTNFSSAVPQAGLKRPTPILPHPHGLGAQVSSNRPAQLPPLVNTQQAQLQRQMVSTATAVPAGLQRRKSDASGPIVQPSQQQQQQHTLASAPSSHLIRATFDSSAMAAPSVTHSTNQLPASSQREHPHHPSEKKLAQDADVMGSELAPLPESRLASESAAARTADAFHSDQEREGFSSRKRPAPAPADKAAALCGSASKMVVREQRVFTNGPYGQDEAVQKLTFSGSSSDSEPATSASQSSHDDESKCAIMTATAAALASPQKQSYADGTPMSAGKSPSRQLNFANPSAGSVRAEAKAAHMTEHYPESTGESSSGSSTTKVGESAGSTNVEAKPDSAQPTATLTTVAAPRQAEQGSRREPGLVRVPGFANYSTFATRTGQDPAHEYEDDIHAALLELESTYCPRPDYMEAVQNDISYGMRAILVDWLVEVADEYQLGPQTLYLAVQYVDRLLSIVAIHRTKLQLVGVTAILVAAKYEEIYAPTVDQLVYISDNTYQRQEVVRMETILLTSLGFGLCVPTAYDFCARYCRAGSLRGLGSYLAMYICEAALQDAVYVVHKPSAIAAAAVLLARYMLLTHHLLNDALPAAAQTLDLNMAPQFQLPVIVGYLRAAWPPSLVALTQFTASALAHCVSAVAAVVTRIMGWTANPTEPREPPRAVTIKYSSPKFEAVATRFFPPMDVTAYAMKCVDFPDLLLRVSPNEIPRDIPLPGTSMRTSLSRPSPATTPTRLMAYAHAPTPNPSPVVGNDTELPTIMGVASNNQSAGSPSGDSTGSSSASELGTETPDPDKGE